jgi:hypothetical protein
VANEPRPRTFILQWRSAVLNSQQASTVKLCLVALAEWANTEGGSCYPSIPSIAAAASVNEKTVRRSLDYAESAGFLLRARKGADKDKGWGCRRYDYQLTIPAGANEAPVSRRKNAGTESALIEHAGTESASNPGASGHCVQTMRTLSPKHAGIESTDLSRTYPAPREEANEATSNAARPVDLWADGIALLTSAGTSREQAGATIGKLRKALGEDEARSIVAKMLVTRPTGPKSYLYGVIRERERALGRVPRDSRSEDAIARANDEALARLGVAA